MANFLYTVKSIKPLKIGYRGKKKTDIAAFKARSELTMLETFACM